MTQRGGKLSPSRALVRAAITVLLGAAVASCTPTTVVHPTTSPSASASAAPIPSATLTPVAAPTPTATPPLVTGVLHPESVTFVSPSDGFVLGLTSCTGVTCLRIARTDDAGVAWAWVTSTGLAGLDPTQWWRIRFANTLDGWISGPMLLATHDGGATWRTIHLPGVSATGGDVGALETADGRVYAEVSEGSDDMGSVGLFGSAVNSDSWYSVSGVTAANGSPGQISVAQGAFTVTLSSATSAALAVYRSTDGVSWRKVSQPCSGSVSQFAEGVVSVARTWVMAVCDTGGAAGSESKTAYLSTDGGVSYRRVGDPPFGGDTEATAGVGTTLMIAAASGATDLYASFNAGQTWATVLLIGSGGIPFTDLGFTTPTQGVAIFGLLPYASAFALYMTRDGGHTWKPIAIRP